MLHMDMLRFYEFKDGKKGVLLRLPATWAIPSERPTVEYVKDITAATIDSHHTWSKSGIWENNISVIPKVIMYPLLDMWHGSFPPLLWKQFDLFIALNYTKGSNIRVCLLPLQSHDLRDSRDTNIRR